MKGFWEEYHDGIMGVGAFVVIIVVIVAGGVAINNHGNEVAAQTLAAFVEKCKALTNASEIICKTLYSLATNTSSGGSTVVIPPVY